MGKTYRVSMTLIGELKNQNYRDGVADLPSMASLRRQRVIPKAPKYNYDLGGKFRGRARVHHRSRFNLTNSTASWVRIVELSVVVLCSMRLKRQDAWLSGAILKHSRHLTRHAGRFKVEWSYQSYVDTKLALAWSDHLAFFCVTIFLAVVIACVGSGFQNRIWCYCYCNINRFLSSGFKAATSKK